MNHSTTPPRCAVVGAANVDIGGFPAGRMAMRDSNPGIIRLSAGGVGRNIACNLARLGVETHLITALGADAFSEVILKDCATAGVRTDLAFRFQGAASSAYLFIADSDGDMQLAVNDMAICDRLTPEALAGRVDALNEMDAVILDANLSTQALGFLAQSVQVPLLADAVSSAKAPRLAGALPRLRALKPNAIEAENLTGIPVHGPASAARAAEALVDRGVSRVYVTMGEKGVCLADADGAQFIPGASLRMVNATGAGDAFTAALAWGELKGLSPRACALAGLAAGSIAVESPDTVSPGMSEAALKERMNTLTALLGNH